MGKALALLPHELEGAGRIGARRRREQVRVDARRRLRGAAGQPCQDGRGAKRRLVLGAHVFHIYASAANEEPTYVLTRGETVT